MNSERTADSHVSASGHATPAAEPDGMSAAGVAHATAAERKRYALLQRLEDRLDVPMTFLAFVWLALLVGEFVWGESRWFEILGSLIWAVFILNFTIELAIAPRKLAYVRRNWLTALSLFAPALRALRVFRVLQVTRAGRGLQLLRVLDSLSRGMHALGASLKRRGFRYVAMLTLIVTFTGAAAIYAFENGPSGDLRSYWDAL